MDKAPKDDDDNDIVRCGNFTSVRIYKRKVVVKETRLKNNQLIL